MDIRDSLTRDQKAELISIFRTEAIEHVDSVLGILMSYDPSDPSRDAVEYLTRASSQLGILSSSAELLQFKRISILANGLIEVFTHMLQSRLITPSGFDLCLETVEVLRQSIESDLENTDVLTDNEVQQLNRLALFAEPGGEAQDGRENVQAEQMGLGDISITREQLEELCDVFRSEANEHLKKLAEVLFTLEEPSAEENSLALTELMAEAGRHAHSLKGSAGSLGFERISSLVHRFEDVIVILKEKIELTNAAVVDQLLEALDAITSSVRTSIPGDDRLTDDEHQVQDMLQELAKQLKTGNPPKPEQLSRPPSVASTMSSQPLVSKPIVEFGQTKSEPGKEQSTKGTDEFIRIAQSNLDSVIAQVSELFETSVQFESFGDELNGIWEIARDSMSQVGAFRTQMSGLSEVQSGVTPLVEKTKNLCMQLGAVVKRYQRNTHQLTRLLNTAQEELRKVRMAPVSNIYVTIKRHVREISKITGKRIDLYLEGGEYTVDRKILEAIEEPIVHILRNAIDHGIEAPDERQASGKREVGHLSVITRHTGDAVEMHIGDDGRGIDAESIRRTLQRSGRLNGEQIAELSLDQLYDYLFETGFSTQKEVSTLSGRGMGLDVVKYTVERFGGEVRLDSRPGEGSLIVLRLPLTMSMVRCLLVRVGDRILGIPASNVEKVLVLKSSDVQPLGDGEVIQHLGIPVPHCSLGEIFGVAQNRTTRTGRDSLLAVLVRFGDRQYSFGICEVIEYMQLILKPLGDLLERVQNVAGVALLGSGELALVVNPADLVRTAGEISRGHSRFSSGGSTAELRTILFVGAASSSDTVERLRVESSGFNVLTAASGQQALEVLFDQQCDLVLSDVDVPDMESENFIRTVKNDPSLANVPVILLRPTTLTNHSINEKSMADAFLDKKDLNSANLVNAINSFI